MNERGEDLERRGKWPYVLDLAQISVQVTKQHGPELFCIIWALHVHTGNQTDGICLCLVISFTFRIKHSNLKGDRRTS